MWFFWFMIDGDAISSGGGSEPTPSYFENYGIFPLNSIRQRII